MNNDLPQNLARLLKKYARDLEQISPSDSLDARIDGLVAGHAGAAQPAATRHKSQTVIWAAAACLAVVAVAAGIIIGMQLERAREVAAIEDMARDSAQQVAWSPEDLSMWPTDSVALTIPAEYSAQGTLVAVNPKDKSTGKRFLVDVVVSNDGTVRIERIMPATGDEHSQADENGVRLQVQ